jgi:hypothetical protein
MRVMLKANWDIEAGNAAARDGSLGTKVQSILEQLKPEAAYFLGDNGSRTALLFLNLDDSSQIPGVAEPWFLAFNAKVELSPVMNPEDLARAGEDIQQAVQQYG